MKNKFYNKFHSKSKKSKFLLTDGDYTYQTLISLTKKYLIKNQTLNSVIDIGCGVGLFDIFLAENGFNVLGIDVSSNAIQIAKKNIPENLKKYISFKNMDINTCNINKKFDIVICSEVLEHLADDRKCIIKIGKLLNKSGLLIISVPSINAPLYRLGLLKNFDRRVGHIRRYSVENLTNLLHIKNFKILEIIKTEGIIRNGLFTSTLGGFLLKIVNKFKLGRYLNYIDSSLIGFVGESNIYIIAQKI